MKKFLAKNWSLILVVIYIILPDLFPGPIDDIALLIVERSLNLLIKKLKQRPQKNETLNTSSSVQNN